MSKLFNIRPRWRNLLLARILLFAISIVLSSSGEDIGPNDTIEESLASTHRLQSGGMYIINVRGLQSKSAKSSKSNKSSKSKGSKSKASKISGSKSKAASKMGKSSDKSKAAKSKAAKGSESKSKIGKSKSKASSKSKTGKSKSKASKSKSKVGKSLKSLDSGDDTDESRDGNSSSDSVESDTQPVKDNEKSGSVEMSSLNPDDIDYVDENKSLNSSNSHSGSMDAEEAVENIDIISNEEAIVSTKDKTYNAVQLSISSEEKTNIDTTQLVGDFMEEIIDESEDTEVDIDEIMTEIIEESEAFDNMFDESDTELDPSRESVDR